MSEQEWLIVQAAQYIELPPRGRNEWILFLNFRERLIAEADRLMQP